MMGTISAADCGVTQGGRSLTILDVAKRKTDSTLNTLDLSIAYSSTHGDEVVRGLGKIANRAATIKPTKVRLVVEPLDDSVGHGVDAADEGVVGVGSIIFHLISTIS